MGEKRGRDDRIVGKEEKVERVDMSERGEEGIMRRKREV